MAIGAGELDRRVTVQIAQISRDRTNDTIKTWSLDAGKCFKRWSRKADSRGGITQGDQQNIREADTVFTLRKDSQSESIAPETHRFFYKARVYEIVGIQEGKDERGETLEFLTSHRPDGGGPRGPVAGNGK